MNDGTYLVAGRTRWAASAFDERLADAPGLWRFVREPAELSAVLEEGTPRFIFFLHWSWIVPEDVVSSVECVCFHMTDLPEGRGGSPLQNLIVAGREDTVLTAFRMDTGLDTGPVYAKRPLSMLGAAEEVYLRAARMSADLARWIAEVEPMPIPQRGAVSVLRRRTPDDSEIPASIPSLDALHNHLRMLDAEGYPHAFFEHGGYRYTFRRAVRYTERIEADVVITLAEGDEL